MPLPPASAPHKEASPAWVHAILMHFLHDPVGHLALHDEDIFFWRMSRPFQEVGWVEVRAHIPSSSIRESPSLEAKDDPKDSRASQLGHVLPHHAAMLGRKLSTYDNHLDRDYCMRVCSMKGQEDHGDPRGRMVQRHILVQQFPNYPNALTAAQCHQLCASCGAHTNGIRLT